MKAVLKKAFGRASGSTIRTRITLALIAMALLPMVGIMLFYYRNMKVFYAERIDNYRVNMLELMQANVNGIVEQIRGSEYQLLEYAVVHKPFENYAGKTMYQRLQLLRNMEVQLSNIRSANSAIENIYMVGVEGNAYTSNSEWDEGRFLAHSWVVLGESEGMSRQVLPAHQADYRYRHQQFDSPVVVSVVNYLGTAHFTEGIIQIDIDQAALAGAMTRLPMTADNHAYLVGRGGDVLFQPADLPQKAEAAPSLEQLQAHYTQSGQGELRLGSWTVNFAEVPGSDWYIIQLGSDAELQQELQSIQRLLLTVSLLVFLAAALLAFSLSLQVTKPIHRISKAMQRLGDGELSSRVPPVPNKDLRVLSQTFNAMADQINVLMRENINKENARIRTEMTALSSQINSHFLYNTLNMMKWRAQRAGEEEIVHCVVALVGMLEYSSKSLGEMVPLQSEIEFIENYIYIQSSRFAKKIEFTAAIEDGLAGYKIPKMLLQPFVENSVVHGFAGRSEGNRVSIKAFRAGGGPEIEIRDNGAGFVYHGLGSLQGTGIQNVVQRVGLNFGLNSMIHLESVPGEGTVVRLTLEPATPDNGDSYVESTVG